MTFKNYRVQLLSLVAGGMLLAACGPSNSAAPAQSVAATDTPTAAVATATTAIAADPATPAAAQPANQAQTKLNLNTASDDEFKTIPNVSDRMVREFKEYRPYTSIQQFRKEIGKYVDAAQVADYEKYVFVPVAPNDADADTLQQLPGVDAAIADQLIAGRPYAAPADFLKKLGEVVTPEQLATAQGYVEAQ